MFVCNAPFNLQLTTPVQVPAMNVAVSTDIATVIAPSERKVRTCAVRIDVYDDLTKAEPTWRRLEAIGALSTPYQRFEWIALWHQHVSSVEGITPLIIVASDATGAPMFLLPLARRSKGPLTIAGFFGGRHANL